MTFQEFKLNIVEAIKEIYPQADVELTSILKNNSNKLTGLIVKDKSINITPTIYLDYYYNKLVEGETFENIVDSINRSYINNKIDKDFNISFFLNYSSVKNGILFKLINRDRNAQLLESVPYIEYLDLAIVFYYVVNISEICEDAKGSILITNEHMSHWNVSVNDLMLAAKNNTKSLCGYSFNNMFEILFNKYTDFANKEDLITAQNSMPLFIVSNDMLVNGASTILYEDTLSDIALKVRGSYYILPSSIHELIIVPADEYQNDQALFYKNMVCNVNRENLDEVDILSDSVYFYNNALNELTICA
ncbi:MAG: hypothetical protein HUJ71_03445 [Pseudobutyrivibrio sp.]|nr:hypothetical protein [Pseudobutyrivibrio sp.]